MNLESGVSWGHHREGDCLPRMGREGCPPDAKVRVERVDSQWRDGELEWYYSIRRGSTYRYCSTRTYSRYFLLLTFVYIVQYCTVQYVLWASLPICKFAIQSSVHIAQCSVQTIQNDNEPCHPHTRRMLTQNCSSYCWPILLARSQLQYCTVLWGLISLYGPCLG